MERKILILEAEHPPDLQVYQAAMAEALPPGRVALHLAASEEAALHACADCTALVAKAHAVSRRLILAMPQLDWIQALTTGTDHLEKIGVPPDICITSMRGIHGPQMSELAMMLMLALARGLPRMLESQAASRWERRPQPILQGKTVLVVGIGAISEALAMRCIAFGMRVIGASGRAGAVEGFAEILPYERLGEAAAQADFMVVVTPYTAATHHIVNEAVIARMKPTAFLINIARGNVVDEAALLSALSAGRIAGAGLDVFSSEPLPADNPFWSMPNVIVTPHIGGMSDSYAHQAAATLAANVAAYCAEGVPALNVVRKGLLF
jgi:phosphoglycerate dehydrogenase-like enzyme